MRNAPDISVVIPTYNRRETLQRCLDLYRQQTFPMERFEIVVVDDGSSDHTCEMLREWGRKSAYGFSFHRKDNGGPGSARNVGVDQTSGKIVLIVGDDIFPDPNLLLEHWTWHSEKFPEEHEGVLGFVTWVSDPPPSPLMLWLERGYQNAFHLLTHGQPAHWRFSYAGNISMKKSFLVKTGERFDERFPPYGYEDVEWGFRLFQKGFRLIYHGGATGFHSHWITLEDSLTRMRKVGNSAKILKIINRNVYDAIIGDLFPEEKWKRFPLDFFLIPAIAENLILPWARRLERKKINSYIYSLSHQYYFRLGYHQEGNIVLREPHGS